MSAVSETRTPAPVIVVQRHELDVRSDEDESDDEVFVNPTALAMESEVPTNQLLLKTRPRPMQNSPLQATGFLKLTSGVQFARNWAQRVARPLDYHQSAAATTDVRPSRLFIRSSSVQPPLAPDHSVSIEFVSILKNRLIWNPNGNFLYL